MGSSIIVRVGWTNGGPPGCRPGVFGHGGFDPLPAHMTRKVARNFGFALCFIVILVAFIIVVSNSNG